MLSLFKKILRRLDPVEREFRQIYPTIKSIEGHLVSPMQEHWMFRMAKSLSDGCVILEIGSFKGRSACTFIEEKVKS